MTIKIGNIQRFTRFPTGTALHLPGEAARRVKLQVNTEYDTRLDVVTDAGEVLFLARVNGLQTVEFVIDGPADVLATSEGEVWLSTDEGRHITYKSGKPSFVTLDFERTPELTEYEKLMAIANLKREQREAEERAIWEARMAELQEKVDGATQKPANSGAGGGGEEEAGDSAGSDDSGEGEA